MASLFFTQAAAARLLPFATKIEAVRVFRGSIQITYLTKNGRCSTFLSKTAFFQDFVTFRQEGAKNCTVRRWGAGSFTHHYECFSAKSGHALQKCGYTKTEVDEIPKIANALSSMRTPPPAQTWENE
jgi:hypothetical protein